MIHVSKGLSTTRVNLVTGEWSAFKTWWKWLALKCEELILHNNTCMVLTWWRHQMKSFSALLGLCEGKPSVTGGFPHKGQWRGALMFYFTCAWKKRLSKQSTRWRFETLSCSLWRHCNEVHPCWCLSPAPHQQGHYWTPHKHSSQIRKAMHSKYSICAKTEITLEYNVCYISSLMQIDALRQYIYIYIFIWVNVGWGNGLLPDDNEPLP